MYFSYERIRSHAFSRNDKKQKHVRKIYKIYFKNLPKIS